mgnify:FL=1
MANKREIWIDWTKVIGMLLIVWGHFFPDIATNFIYAFSVPLFFFMSGFLTKNDAVGHKLFLKKIWTSLALPYLIISVINCIPYWLKHIYDGGIWYSMFAILTGFHNIHDMGGITGIAGCGTMWFVYTLLIIKTLNHFWGGCAQHLFS